MDLVCFSLGKRPQFIYRAYNSNVNRLIISHSIDQSHLMCDSILFLVSFPFLSLSFPSLWIILHVIKWKENNLCVPHFLSLIKKIVFRQLKKYFKMRIFYLQHLFLFRLIAVIHTHIFFTFVFSCWLVISSMPKEINAWDQNIAKA